MAKHSVNSQKWSKYKCKCFAVDQCQCICTSRALTMRPKNNWDKITWNDVEHQYAGFGKWRKDIQTSGMPDYRKRLFSNTRIFDGQYFSESEPSQ